MDPFPGCRATARLKVQPISSKGRTSPLPRVLACCQMHYILTQSRISDIKKNTLVAETNKEIVKKIYEVHLASKQPFNVHLQYSTALWPIFVRTLPKTVWIDKDMLRWSGTCIGLFVVDRAGRVRLSTPACIGWKPPAFNSSCTVLLYELPQSEIFVRHQVRKARRKGLTPDLLVI